MSKEEKKEVGILPKAKQISHIPAIPRLTTAVGHGFVIWKYKPTSWHQFLLQESHAKGLGVNEFVGLKTPQV